MLKAEYPCRETFSPHKPVITWAEAKKHLHDVRLRRQNELAKNIDECYKLRNIHKQIFDRQLKNENIPIKSNNHEFSSHTNKYSIPRTDYAPIIYRQVILPTFEVEKSLKLENDIPILNEPSCAISNNKTENSQLPTMKKDQKRRLSVSTVSSVDKRANKVYEKWPDYDHISEIVGYRIDPPISKMNTSNSITSRPSDINTQRKRNKSAGFSTTSKQIKTLVRLNPSPTRRQSSKTKKSAKTEIITPIIIDKPIPKTPIKDTKPKLPNILCPSSVSYSNRIQTRQWLTKNHFSSNAVRTLPLI